MSRRLGIALGFLAVLHIAGSPALACSLCGTGNPQTTLSLRQDIAQAKLVLFGALADPKLNPGGTGGTTKLKIERVIKNDPFLADRKEIELPRYVPVPDPKNPPRFLVFCDIFNGKLDPYRGSPVKSAAMVDYLKGASALDPKNQSANLQYFFRFLDHTDPDISNDAFLEFAKASDPEVGHVASKLSAAKIRSWMQNPQTPANRLSLYAFMLGACGGDEDAATLREMLQKPADRTIPYLGGILAGYIQLRPKDGWDLSLSILRDTKKSFPERFAILGTLRFYHGWKPDDTRREVLRGLALLVEQGDIADLAIEDLRKWSYWDVTSEVLDKFNRKSHSAPIMRRAIVRYALTCPLPEVKRFVDTVRKQDPELLKDVEESLEFDKKK